MKAKFFFYFFPQRVNLIESVLQWNFKNQKSTLQNIVSTSWNGNQLYDICSDIHTYLHRSGRSGRHKMHQRGKFR